MEGYGAGGRPGVDDEELNNDNDKKESNDDLLACHKCKQFGHLSYQCMNMFSKEGTRGQGNHQLLTAATDPVPDTEEEIKERMLTEKATELM